MSEKINWFHTKSTGQNLEIYWSDLTDVTCMGMERGVGTGVGHRGITCVLQTQFPCFCFIFAFLSLSYVDYSHKLISIFFRFMETNG